MTFTHDELKKKTTTSCGTLVMGMDNEAVNGTQMNRAPAPAICKVLGIDTHHHHCAAVTGHATRRGAQDEAEGVEGGARQGACLMTTRVCKRSGPMVR